MPPIINYPLFFLLLLSAFGCEPSEVPDPVSPPQDTTAMDTALTFLALGDSYTIGESVDPADRWPVQLALAASTDGRTVAPPVIVATTGWTTDELREGIAARNDLADQYDWVSLLIGVNNQYRGQSIEVYKTEFAELLAYAIEKSGTGKDGVFVVSIPDYAYTPFGAGRASISEGVDAFNAAADSICNARDIPFLNITPISRQGLDDPELVADDRLHPSGKQYRRWVEEVILPKWIP